MALDYPALLEDLRHEGHQLAECLVSLTPEQWDLSTPAAGWSIRDQVTHLAFFDDAARTAMVNPDSFRAEARELISGGMNFPDRVAVLHRDMAGATVLDWFTGSRGQLLRTFAPEDPKRRVPWFGPDMSVASSATARLMETWAHAQDVYDTLGVAHPASPGLRSIAHLGVATFAFAHTLNGLEVPAEPVRVSLTSTTGDTWSWGPEDAENVVTGPAEDFVLTVTQRRRWTETGLRARGDVATGWLDIAQAYAGAPGRRSPSGMR